MSVSYKALTSVHALNGLLRNRVLRWQGHPGTTLGDYRVQSNDDHRRELLQLLVSLLVLLRSRNFQVDEHLLMTAVWHHDDAEDFGMGDTLSPLKNVNHDVAEYNLFCRVIQPNVSAEEWAHLERAFLLQFATKHRENTQFSDGSREIMANLVTMRPAEVLIFEFLERLDYLMYAVEQATDKSNPHFIREVYPNQARKLDDLLKRLPELKGFYWREPIGTYCETVISSFGPLVIQAA